MAHLRADHARVIWRVRPLAQFSLAAGLASGHGARFRVYARLRAGFLLGVCFVMPLPLRLSYSGNDVGASPALTGRPITAATVVIAAIFSAFAPELAARRERHQLGLGAHPELVARGGPPWAALVAAMWGVTELGEDD